ncbi:Uncharacterised protein [Salmonella enterica subsp. arizonae]|uniref:Uncharacterized protein n=1 Tax=Salmonella enterica subsp. arizonae TaxID=59203 RepID=A0A379S1D9_SALER|nr:Uncharacterised protein [Salmonella enterica subsp. arizonae]
MPDGAVLIRPVFPLIAASFLNLITITAFPFSLLRRDGYSSNSSDHITIILHNGYVYELPVAVRPARSGLYHSQKPRVDGIYAHGSGRTF